jgi:hypothetical protein
MADIQITIDPEGMQWIQTTFGMRKLLSVIKSGMNVGLLKVWEQIPEYPEPRQFQNVPRSSSLYSAGSHKVAGQKGRYWASSYKRTGTLGRSISTKSEIIGDNVQGMIGTSVSKQTAASGYASYVIGDDGEQAWMHVGRWWQLSKVVAEHADDISQAINDAISNFIDTSEVPSDG